MVYDVLGNKIETLANNESQNIGKHSLEFDAKNHAAGIYLVTVNIGGQAYTKRIVLTK